MNIFEFVRYQNAKVHAKHLHEEIKQHYQKRVLTIILSLLRIKTLKCMQSILYGKSKHYKKFVF